MIIASKEPSTTSCLPAHLDHLCPHQWRLIAGVMQPRLEALDVIANTARVLSTSNQATSTCFSPHLVPGRSVWHPSRHWLIMPINHSSLHIILQRRHLHPCHSCMRLSLSPSSCHYLIEATCSPRELLWQHQMHDLSSIIQIAAEKAMNTLIHGHNHCWAAQLAAAAC